MYTDSNHEYRKGSKQFCLYNENPYAGKMTYLHRISSVYFNCLIVGPAYTQVTELITRVPADVFETNNAWYTADYEVRLFLDFFLIMIFDTLQQIKYHFQNGRRDPVMYRSGRLYPYIVFYFMQYISSSLCISLVSKN